MIVSLALWALATLSLPATGDLETVTLAAGHGRYVVEGKPDSSAAWVRFSIPIPFEGQTPLAIRVTSQPSGAAVGVQIDEERENRFLHVLLRPLAAGEKVEIQADTLVLLREREYDDGKGVALPDPSALPADVQEYLSSAPGVETDDPEITKIAKDFPRKDLHVLVEAMLGFLTKHVEGGSGLQGAKDVLRTGKAACTGHANLGAALLIAARVPARILPCILIGVEQQEHYIVEVWSKKLGWSRIETTSKEFPALNSTHLILRVTYPSSPRSGGSVPLYLPQGEGVTAKYGQVGATPTCWQSAEVIETCAIDRKDADAFEHAARQAFASLAKTASKSAIVRLVETKKPPASVGKHGRKLLAEVEERLGK